METYEAIMGRRSFRKFQQRKISKSLLKKMIEAARMAPSGMNLQPIEYILIDESNLIKEVFEFTEWAGYKFKDGPMPGEEPIAYIAVISNNEVNLKGAPLDAGLAIENIMLEAYSEGVGSCCLGAINRPKLSKLLGVSNNYYLIMLVALGYPKQEARTIDSTDKKIKTIEGITYVSKMPLNKVLHDNKF
jgi:FMN reductase [NAD(P)H]